jgi:hypothetical protein
MTRTVTADGVDFDLRGPRDGGVDLATQLVGLAVSTPLAMMIPLFGAAVSVGQGDWPDLFWTLLAMSAFGALGFVGGIVGTEAWWASGRRRTLSIRSWGLLIEGERLPWEAIEAVGVSKRTFSIATRTGRHWSFFQPGYDAGAEVDEAVRRGHALSDRHLTDAQRQAMRGLTGA